MNEKELDCSNASSSTNSLVLYGRNSTGKTSFVDGIEWFLSPTSQINWLRREQAKEGSYPHHEATESYVEIIFNKNGTDTKLCKTFDHSRKTIPILSSETEFEIIQKSFVIRPHLRYQEIVEFVLNNTGSEKYKKLAEWMGFESELSFQKKLAEIITKLDSTTKNIEEVIEKLKKEITLLADHSVDPTQNNSLTLYANNLLSEHDKSKQLNISSLDDLEKILPEVGKLRTQSDLSAKLSALTNAQVEISTKTFSPNLLHELTEHKTELAKFNKDEETARNVETLSLYQKAQELLAGNESEIVQCPICHTDWQRDKLLEHIRTELAALDAINKQQEELSEKIKIFKDKVESDLTIAREIILIREKDKIIPPFANSKIKVYLQVLDSIFQNLNSEKVLDSASIQIPDSSLSEDIMKEKSEIIDAIGRSIKELKPSKEDEQLSNNIDKLNKLSELWRNLETESEKKDFYGVEIEKFKEIYHELNQIIKDDIQNRFDEVSELIKQYFAKLRNDKDIKDIQITYNLSARAESRSAEIELLYYNIEVKPAYKVLSESLLSSLGISVYLACVKMFNVDTKFIILDDVINSLDGQNRPKLIDLLIEEFSNYQIIIFTHDRLWFDLIKNRCPNWIKKKIIDWDYNSGPQIGLALSTKDELHSMLKDDSQAERAGREFGVHVEGKLNQLAENLEAKLKYRYMKQDPPSLKELFDALNARFKELRQKGAIATSHSIMSTIGKASNDDPFIRNVCSHDRQNYESSLGAQEVELIVDQWFEEIEQAIGCNECNEMIYFNRKANKVTCPCGLVDLTK